MGENPQNADPASPAESRARVSFPAVAAFVVAVNATLLSAVFASQLSSFLAAAIAYFTAVAIVVTVALLMALAAGWRWLAPRRLLAAIACGTLCALGVGYFLVPTLISADAALKLALPAAAFAGGLVFVLVRRFRLPAFVFLGLFVVLTWVSPFVRGGAPVVSAPAANDDATASTVANLARARRNIYVLMFDAFVSDEGYETFFRPHSQVGALPWKAALLAEGMAHYPSALSPSYLSHPSFYRLLALGIAIDPEREVARGFFSGALPVPAYAIAHSAGMRAQFMSTSSYFGIKSGPYIDYLFPENVTGLCAFVAADFLGIACRPWMLEFAYRIGIEHRIPTEYAEDSQQEASLLPEIQSRVSAIQGSATKWVTIVYLWTPGHVLPGHDFRRKEDMVGYVAMFDGEAVTTARIASDLVRMIKRSDPTGIIVVAGDHGARITQRGEDVLPQHLLELDGRGVGFFVYPPGTCAATFKAPRYDLGYLLRDLYACVEPPS